MLEADLFKHSKALNNTPAFRNIHRRPGPAAFDDLLDPQEADPGSPLAQLALRKANRVRSNVSPFALLDAATHYGQAIQSVFQRGIFYPTRYGDGSYPVWYGCLDERTTIYETAFHMIQEEMALKDHPIPIVRHRMVYKVACTAILIDLTKEKRYFPQLTDASNYRFTQQVGKRIRTEMHPGLLAPSARRQDGINLAAFTPKVLSTPELVGHLRYQLDPQSMSLTVTDESGHRPVATIDGRVWF